MSCINYIILMWDPFSKIWKLADNVLYPTQAIAESVVEQFFCDEQTRSRLAIRAFTGPSPRRLNPLTGLYEIA